MSNTTQLVSADGQKPKVWVFAKSAPWHKQAIAELENDLSIIEQLMAAERRTMYLGLKLLYIKMRGKADKSIPHGQFEPFLAHHFPSVPPSTLSYCMTKARNACERMGWQLTELPDLKIPPHQLLIDAPTDLPPKAQKEKQLLLELVEMRGQFAPVTEYKQVKAGEDLGEETKAIDGSRRGRRKGEGGASKEQREAAAAREESERLESLQSRADEVADWLLENAGVKGFARLDEISGGAKTLKKLADAVAYANTFFTKLQK